MVKDEMRRVFRAKRDAIPEVDRAAYASRLTELIRSLPEYKTASRVLLYRPIGSEPDLLALAEDGKTAAFPVICGGDMCFCVPEGEEDLRPGAMGIPEPDPGKCERVVDFSGAICVVPALAVDKRGYRLGYGGGYYDRFLNGYRCFAVCAVFPQLFVERLPEEPHDVPVDAVAVPGAGITRFR